VKREKGRVKDKNKGRDYKEVEPFEIALTHAFAHPRTMVIQPADADIAIQAVNHVIRLFHSTNFASFFEI